MYFSDFINIYYTVYSVNAGYLQIRSRKFSVSSAKQLSFFVIPSSIIEDGFRPVN